MSKTIIVTKYDNTSDVTFTESYSDAKQSKMINLSSSTAEPESLDFKYDLKQAAQKGNNRATVAVSKVLVNSTTGIATKASVSLTVSVPNNESAWTSTIQKDMLRYLIDLFGGSAGATLFVNFARGITPDGDQHVDGFTA